MHDTSHRNTHAKRNRGGDLLYKLHWRGNNTANLFDTDDAMHSYERTGLPFMPQFARMRSLCNSLIQRLDFCLTGL